jgi:integral membrane sensor domain MASE1
VATLGFRLPRLVPEYRAWRGALRLSDASGAESWRTMLVADAIGLLIVLALGLAIFFALRPPSKSPP